MRVIADQTGASTAEVVAEYAQVFGLDQRAARRLLTHFPVRLWRGKELHRVAGLPGIAALVPQVFVQRVPLSNLRHASTLISSPSRRGELARDPSLARLSRLYEGDAAGSMLVSELNLELAAMSTDRIQTTLDTIEKKGNVVYARIESVLGRPVIDDVRRPSYYWTRELIIVTTATDLYLVKTFLPHADYREGADSVWISRWLTQFKIVGT